MVARRVLRVEEGPVSPPPLSVVAVTVVGVGGAAPATPSSPSVVGPFSRTDRSVPPSAAADEGALTYCDDAGGVQGPVRQSCGFFPDTRSFPFDHWRQFQHAPSLGQPSCGNLAAGARA